MLIDSPRLTVADRAHWARMEHYDDALSRDPHLDELAARAHTAITDFAADGDCYVSVSWGKDSVVAAHLAAQAIPDIRVVWVRSIHFDTPECDLVRDAYLTIHPSVRYQQIDVQLRNPKRGEPGYDDRHLDPHADHQDILKETLTGRYISGLRAEESRIRRISIAHRGINTRNTCRPLAHWDATHIYAYLHREQLPVHPVYAMTAGGTYDRRWLRVHPLCSAPPAKSAARGLDMTNWEDTYYGDVITAAHAARRHLWTGAQP